MYAGQLETDTQRKDRQLFEMAGMGKRPFIPDPPCWHGMRCDACANWAVACLAELGPMCASSNYCHRRSRGFKFAEIAVRKR